MQDELAVKTTVTEAWEAICNVLIGANRVK
jgi:hypothetical protein